MSNVVGVDCGGSKSILVSVNRQGVLQHSHRNDTLSPAPSSDWAALLCEIAQNNMSLYSEADAVVLALPFFGEIPQCTANQTAAAKSLSPKADVENDVRVAFEGAFAGGPGALVLSGTGSMAWASSGGTGAPHFRVGGWGERFGDEGSGFWIGREALATMSHHLDGRKDAADFTAQMLKAMSISADELMEWAFKAADPRKPFAALAIHVANLADQNNPDAIKIIERAAGHLADQLTAAWRKTNSAEPIIWSYSGSVTNNQLLRTKITEQLGAQPQPPKLPPIGGALLMAARSAGWEIADDWVAQIKIQLDEL